MFNSVENNEDSVGTLSDLYKSSPAFTNIMSEYLQYAKYTVQDRALVGLDGCKPSQRRLIAAMAEIEKMSLTSKNLVKCSAIVGSALKLSPHGDKTTYDTLCRMVESGLYMRVTPILGKGSFKKSYSGELTKSGAPRYTECTFTPIAKEYLSDLEGVKRVPNFDESRTEPELLGVSFPSILCNASNGIAVSLASNLIPFNFHDVLKATIELIRTDTIKDYLIPDYPTGAEYVLNPEALKKIMQTGRGEVKLRGTWTVEGKVIHINSIPFYTNVDDVIREARKIQNVANVTDVSGFLNGQSVMGIEVTCSNKTCVQYVIEHLISDTPLQLTTNANYTILVDGGPVTLGLIGVLKHWVLFRKSVLTTQMNKEIAALKQAIEKYEVFCALTQNAVLLKEYMENMIKSESLAKRILLREFPNASEFVLEWVLDQKSRKLAPEGGALKKLDNYKTSLATVEYNIEHLDDYIVKQLEEINLRYSYPRITPITDVDYNFTATVKEEIVPVYMAIRDKFIVKLPVTKITSLHSDVIECKSNDTLYVIDSEGRLIRVFVNQIGYTSGGSKGIYLPAYCSIPDDAQVLDWGVLDGSTVNYLYSDGFVSSLNLAEWSDTQRATKVTPRGMPQKTNLICATFSPEAELLYFKTNLNRFGFYENSFKVKSRTARTKLVDLKENEQFTSFLCVRKITALRAVPNLAVYLNKLGYLLEGDSFEEALLKEV